MQKRKFRILICQLRSRLLTFISFNNFAISYRVWYTETKKWNILKKFEFDFVVNKSIVNYYIENCEWYEIKFSLLKTTSNQNIKSCFFLNHSKKYFFKFLTQIDYELRKIFDAKITITMIFRINDFRCENYDYNDFSNQKIYKFKNFCYNANEKILIISKNFDVKKKTYIKHSKFMSTKNSNRISTKLKYASWLFAKQISNSKKYCLHFFVQ